MSIDPDFDPFQQKMPPSVRLFGEIQQITHKYLGQLKEEFTNKHGFEPPRETYTTWNRDESSFYPINLLGADEVQLVQISDRDKENQDSATAALIKLRRDGNTYVLPEDSARLAAEPNGLHWYDVVCFPEHPPLLVHSDPIDAAIDAIRKAELRTATFEDAVSYLRIHGIEPRYLDEGTSSQVIEILNNAPFVPTFELFEEELS